MQKAFSANVSPWRSFQEPKPPHGSLLYIWEIAVNESWTPLDKRVAFAVEREFARFGRTISILKARISKCISDLGKTAAKGALDEAQASSIRVLIFEKKTGKEASIPFLKGLKANGKQGGSAFKGKVAYRLDLQNHLIGILGVPPVQMMPIRLRVSTAAENYDLPNPIAFGADSCPELISVDIQDVAVDSDEDPLP